MLIPCGFHFHLAFCPDEGLREVLVESLEWHPEGAGTSLIIDLPAYFAKVLDG